MKLFLLIKGEFVRLVKYRVLFFSLVVTAIWLIIIALLSVNEARLLSPLLILTDLCMMSILLLAAMTYYEKQEGTLITTLISPVKTSYLVLSKYISQIIIGLLSATLISLCNTIFHGISINYPLMLVYSLLIIICSCSISYILIFYSKDFTSMIVNFAFIMLILFIPTILHMVNVIPDSFKYLLFLSPFHSAEVLINSTMTTGVPIGEILISVGVLTLLSALMIIFGVAKKFKSYAMRG
ncbi:MAG: ABC transporter permease [Clostridia bacterium]|nr:ABC transporter permease [Clostridia bacterium]